MRVEGRLLSTEFRAISFALQFVSYAYTQAYNLEWFDNLTVYPVVDDVGAYTITASPSPVPEPSPLALLFTALAITFLANYRKLSARGRLRQYPSSVGRDHGSAAGL